MSPSACAAPFHLGVQKALGVVASHYQVDFEAVSTGYVVPLGVEDEVAMNRADALAATAADMLTKDFTDFLFPDAPAAVALKPEDHRVFVPFTFLVLVFEPGSYVINKYGSKHLHVYKLKYSFFTPAIVSFCLPIFLAEPWLGKFVRTISL
jgi:hypothetical protein